MGKKIIGDKIIYSLYHSKFRYVKGETADLISKDGYLYLNGDEDCKICKVQTNRKRELSLKDVSNNEVNVNSNKVNASNNKDDDGGMLSKPKPSNPIPTTAKGDTSKELPKKYSQLYKLAVDNGFDIEEYGDRKSKTLRKFLNSINLQE